MKKVSVLLMVTGVIGILASTGISQAALTDGMIALYHFDGNMNDSAPGSSQTGTLSGWAEVNQDDVQVGTGSFESQNGAESKNGNWSFGTVPEGGSIDGSNNWSITFWVKAKATQLWRNAWAFDEPNDTADDADGIRLENGSGGGNDWRFYASGYNGIASHSFQKINEKWTFFALTADGSTLKVYQGFDDGNLSLAYSETIDTGEALKAGGSNGIMILGGRIANPSNAGRLLNCYLDELGIWNRGLSETEVQEIFDAGKAGTNIPEPATIGMMMSGIAGLICKKK